MEAWKEEYRNRKIPEDLSVRIEQSVCRAKADRRRLGRLRVQKRFAGAAAALAIVLILPNTSEAAAAAMQQIPLLGDLFKVVTIREYQVDEERHKANVTVPQIVAADTEVSGENSQAEETMEEINFDIQEKTEQLIEEFRESMGEEGYQDLYIDSQVLTDDERWFSLELILYQGAGSGYEQRKHYTIDKTTGKQALLSELCGEDYVNTVSEEIKTQMRRQMAEDENVQYWLDDPEMSEWNFETISEDQDFYVNADGHVVICFDEYQVAPGAMGYVEFELP